MKRTAYQNAVRVLEHGARNGLTVGLDATDCAALLAALRDLTEAAGRPPRGAVETNPPGLMPVQAMGAEVAPDGGE